MNRVALIAIAAVALAVAGCGSARTPKTAVGANAICMRDVTPLQRTSTLASPPSVAAGEAQRAAAAGCACIVCRPARGQIDLVPSLAPVSRAQLANTIGRVGPIGAMRPTSTPTGTAGYTAPATTSPTIVYLP